MGSKVAKMIGSGYNIGGGLPDDWRSFIAHVDGIVVRDGLSRYSLSELLNGTWDGRTGNDRDCSSRVLLQHPVDDGDAIHADNGIRTRDLSLESGGQPGYRGE